MSTDFGIRLRWARKHAGLTQEQLAEKMGLGQSSVSATERIGQSSTETVRYAEVCGVNAKWLACGEGAWNLGVGEISDTPATPGKMAGQLPDLDMDRRKLSNAAVELGLLLDLLTDRIDRSVAVQGATQAILAVLQKAPSPPGEY
jgi:transcriptional regulator with XRE-family HTH domain